MNAGYIDQHEILFCATCWTRRVQTGSHPAQRLNTEDDLDPENNFWIVDSCASCGREVRYRSIQILQ